MSDIHKTARRLAERESLDLAAYRALAREHRATIRRLAEENQDLRMELHSLQPDGSPPAHDAAAGESDDASWWGPT